MTPAFLSSNVFEITQPTPAELDQFATIGAIICGLGVLAFLCVVGAALAVALKTKFPGRWAIFFSVVLLASWWAVEQVFGGDLEMTFGPIALLLTYTVYSAIACLFSFGYLRMCFSVFRQRALTAANREAKPQA